MRASYGQDRGEGGDGKDAWLYCTYEQYTSKIFQQGRGGKKRYQDAMRRPGGGELRACAPTDIGQKCRLFYLSLCVEPERGVAAQSAAVAATPRSITV